MLIPTSCALHTRKITNSHPLLEKLGAFEIGEWCFNVAGGERYARRGIVKGSAVWPMTRRAPSAVM